MGTTDWVSIDCQELEAGLLALEPHRLRHVFGAFVLLWLIPSFWIGFPLLVVAYVAPLAAYILHRNSQGGQQSAGAHAGAPALLVRHATEQLGMKVEAEKRDPHESGPPVKVFAQGGADERTDAARLLMARQSPGLRTAREILADGLAGRATKIMLDYTQEASGVRTMIDGVWIPWEPRTRENGDPALESLKLLCGLNPQDRQSRQEGTFLAEFDAQELPALFASQGTATGERVLIQFEERRSTSRPSTSWA